MIRKMEKSALEGVYVMVVAYFTIGHNMFTIVIGVWYCVMTKACGGNAMINFSSENNAKTSSSLLSQNDAPGKTSERTLSILTNSKCIYLRRSSHNLMWTRKRLFCKDENYYF